MSKSKKSHSPVNRSVIPRWSWFAIVGLAFVAVLFVFSVVQQSSQVDVGSPKVSVEQPMLDFGDVRYGNPVTAVFNVLNTGDSPLRIVEEPVVEVIQGCCPPPVLLSAPTINPGESGTITLRFSMHEGMGGQHEFLVRLVTNDPSQPETQLRVFSNWIA